ncbi:hypothetical protein ACVWZ4_002482 [Bradyrhizobium sp. USDA 4472]
MASIEVDFDVFKELTIRRATEATTYNDVIRELLGLDKKAVVAASSGGATFKGAHFPEGTKFRATYKGRTYDAEIRSGVWRSSDGGTRNSPSEAAVKITGKHWNGWRFWHCLRPGDTEWQLIDQLRPQSTLDQF